MVNLGNQKAGADMGNDVMRAEGGETRSGGRARGAARRLAVVGAGFMVFGSIGLAVASGGPAMARMNAPSSHASPTGLLTYNTTYDTEYDTTTTEYDTTTTEYDTTTTEYDTTTTEYDTTTTESTSSTQPESTTSDVTTTAAEVVVLPPTTGGSAGGVPAQPSSPSSLPETGGSMIGPLLVGMVALGLGMVLVAAARRQGTTGTVPPVSADS